MTAAQAWEIRRILRDGSYLTRSGIPVDIAARVARSVAETTLWERPPAADPHPGLLTRIEITAETTLAAVDRHRIRGQSPIVLNHGSGISPGGAWLLGGNAQEESLACASTLSANLGAQKRYYRWHRLAGRLRYSDQVIFAPWVLVLRDLDGELVEPWPINVVSAAMPMVLARTNPARVQRRIAAVFAAACQTRVRQLVLGAWGCGAYRNDPAIVAQAFKAELDAVPRAFDSVTFAIPDPRHREIFAAAFAEAGPGDEGPFVPDSFSPRSGAFRKRVRRTG